MLVFLASVSLKTASLLAMPSPADHLDMVICFIDIVWSTVFLCEFLRHSFYTAKNPISGGTVGQTSMVEGIDVDVENFSLIVIPSP